MNYEPQGLLEEDEDLIDDKVEEFDEEDEEDDFGS